MKIIISPAKKMQIPEAAFLPASSPLFARQAQELRQLLLSKTAAELMDLYQCSERTVKPVYEAFQLQQKGIRQTGPALLCYQGLAFRSMAPDVFTDQEWQYVQEHLRIVSGLYGLLRPLDAVLPYRLEMKMRLPFSLYEYWNSQLAEALEDDVIVNLASREYARAIAPYKKMWDVRFFEEYPDGSRKEPGAYAKMARGRMVRWMAENQIQKPEDLSAFTELGYQLDTVASRPGLLVFYRSAAA